MAVEVERRRRFTVDEYRQMGRAGILRAEDRVELLDGEIRQMSAIGNRHYACVVRLGHLFFQLFGQESFVSIQGPVRLSDRDEPEPDLVLVAGGPEFPRRKPTPEEVLLLIEVSDTSLKYDQTEKLPAYARAGVVEVWIVDLLGEVILTFAGPRPDRGDYAVAGRIGRGQELAPACAPRTSIRVDDVLGPKGAPDEDD